MTSESESVVTDEDPLRPPTVFAWVRVVSDTRSADEISSIVGLQPDRAWKIGDRRARTIITEKANGWTISSRLKNVGFEIEDHIDDLLQRVKPIAERFASLPEEDCITVHLAIYSESRISMSFEPHISRLISTLGARLDIEVYFMSPQTRHDADG